MHQQARNIAVTILYHLKARKKTPCKIHLKISKREIRMFSFIHSNFERKHSNLRLRLYLGSKIIGKYSMIAKML